MRNNTLPAQRPAAGAACPVIVHNHYTISGNGNILNNGRDMAINADSAALLATIRAQAGTISQMLETIKEQAAQLAQLKEDLRRATSLK